eukprot:s1232_g9.t1
MLIRRMASLAPLNSARVNTLASLDMAATLDVVSIAQLATIRSLGYEIVPSIPHLNFASGLAFAVFGALLAAFAAFGALADTWPLWGRRIGS